MIRKAILKDVNSIEDTYNEHFQYELNHTAFTVFKKGVYPTKDDAERAIYAGALFVYEENGTIVGSIIIDKVQPIEYATATDTTVTAILITCSLLKRNFFFP